MTRCHRSEPLAICQKVWVTWWKRSWRVDILKSQTLWCVAAKCTYIAAACTTEWRLQHVWDIMTYIYIYIYIYVYIHVWDIMTFKYVGESIYVYIYVCIYVYIYIYILYIYICIYTCLRYNDVLLESLHTYICIYI